MANQADGEKAISELDGQEFAGRQIKVNEAKPREDRGSRGGYGGGGNNYGGGGYGGGRRENRW
jgi:RNA recognition motif-containing protein